MKNALKIYKKDLKNIVTNWVALVVMIALVILPSLYAWFNIKSFWDPYANTSGIKVAVSSEDEGTSIMNKEVNVGDEVIDSLKNNEKIGWTFVTSEEAREGVDDGKYYAAIIIPKDFSQKIGTILDDEPIKAEMEYYVNEKLNPVSPKITGSASETVKNEVTSNFMEEANGTIFEIFNELGVQLEKELPKIENLKEILFKLEEDFPKIYDVVDEGVKTAEKGVNATKKLDENMPKIEEGLDNAIKTADALSNFIDKSNDALKEAEPVIKQDLTLAKETVSSVNNTLVKAKDKIDSNKDEAKVLLTSAKEKLDKNVQMLDSISDVVGNLANLTGNNELKKFKGDLDRISSKLKEKSNSIGTIIDKINKGEPVDGGLLDNSIKISADVEKTLNSIVSAYDNGLGEKIRGSISSLNDKIKKLDGVMKDIKTEMPSIKETLGKVNKMGDMGIDAVKELQTKLPEIESKLKDINSKIKETEDQVSLQDIIGLLTHNVVKVREFIKEPVAIAENRVYPVPNYGSAMSPFFTVLSLWVGALILASLLTTEEHGEEEYKPYEVYIGKYLTFVTMGILQALTVTLGDIFILKTYCVDKGAFIVGGIITAIVFVTIVYTLVSVLGNVGKALSVVLLVLQIAASGGTFPIQVTPPFFQTIYPLMPFAYAIGAMREAVAGMIVNKYVADLGKLAIFFVIFFVAGILLKKLANKGLKGFKDKLNESGLLH